MTVIQKRPDGGTTTYTDVIDFEWSSHGVFYFRGKPYKVTKLVTVYMSPTAGPIEVYEDDSQGS